MKYLQYCFVMLFVGVLSVTQADGQLIRNYINKYKDRTAELSKEYGIPSSIILATAIVESGAGSSRNANLLCNHFGIVGKNKLMKRKPPIKTKYKQYPTIDDSYVAFCRLVSHKKYYPKLKDDMDYKKWVTAIAGAGYSTQADVWKSKIFYTIKKYKLVALDKSSDETREPQKTT